MFVGVDVLVVGVDEAVDVVVVVVHAAANVFAVAVDVGVVAVKKMIGDGLDAVVGVVEAWLVTQKITQPMDLMVISFVGKSYDVAAVAAGVVEDFSRQNWGSER
jgi:hypothetical protein